MCPKLNVTFVMNCRIFSPYKHVQQETAKHSTHIALSFGSWASIEETLSINWKKWNLLTKCNICGKKSVKLSLSAGTSVSLARRAKSIKNSTKQIPSSFIYDIFYTKTHQIENRHKQNANRDRYIKRRCIQLTRRNWLNERIFVYNIKLYQFCSPLNSASLSSALI